MSEDVLFEVDGPVAVITLNRPERLNAISSGIRRGLGEAWQRFEEEESLKVAILTGSGEKAFCAGMDLKEAAATGIGVPPRNFLPVLGDNAHVSKPVIAAVNGVAYAGGWLLRRCAISASRARMRPSPSPRPRSGAGFRGFRR